jgi:SAM-dependent methyltransferase
VSSSYSERHLDPAQALAYRDKFRHGLTRWMSDAREHRIVAAALSAALATLADLPTASLLDFPCGAGRFAPLLAGRVGHYVAADHSPHMLALCEQALRASRGTTDGARFVQGDVLAMPFADRELDVGCCLRLIHHFPDPADRARILRELRRVLAGPLVLSWLSAAAVKQRLHVLRRRITGRPTRRVLLRPAELTAEAAAQGWQVAQTWSLSSLFSGQCVSLLLPK